MKQINRVYITLVLVSLSILFAIPMFYLQKGNSNEKIYKNSEKLDTCYLRTKDNQIYYYSKTYTWPVVYKFMEKINADAESFAVIDESECFAKDLSSVYRNGKKIDGADSNTFALIEKSLVFDYSYDANHVYYRGELVRDVRYPDLYIFRDFNGQSSMYFKVHDRIYAGNKMLDADLKTFKIINLSSSGIAMDVEDVYIFGKKVELKPGDLHFSGSFKYFVGDDKNVIYINTEKEDYTILHNVNAGTFREYAEGEVIKNDNIGNSNKICGDGKVFYDCLTGYQYSSSDIKVKK